VAKAADRSSVTVTVPDEYRDQVPQLMARLEAVTVRPDSAARVVINERTGTVVVPNENVDVREGAARLVQLDEGTTLEAVTRALNALGATPRDIIAILQALKASGALRAELVIL
jgi:flagellar P-ring protein precursor FlgI